VAAIGKDWPGKLQPGPAVSIPVTRCVQLDGCSDGVKGQPKPMLPVKSSCSGDVSFGFSGGPFGPSLMPTEGHSGRAGGRDRMAEGRRCLSGPCLLEAGGKSAKA